MPDKRLCEILYNRLLNELVLWRCSNPLLRMGDVFSCLNFAGNTGSCSTNFRPLLRKPPASDSDLDEFASVNASPSMLACDALSAYRCSVLFRSAEMETNTEEPHSFLELTGDSAEMFIVVGTREKHRSTATDYVYFTTDHLSIMHRNFSHNIRKDNDNYISNEKFSFSKIPGESQVIATMTPSSLQLHSQSGHCLTVSCKMDIDSADQTKASKSLVAINTRDMMLSYEKMSLFRIWIGQLMQLFSPAVYPIPGYVVPLTVTESKFSNYIAYVFVESLDISTNFLKEASLFRLRFIIQDSSMFLGEAEERLPPSSPQLSAATPSISDLVCLMRMGLCEFRLTYQESCDQFSDERVPRLDLSSKNDVLHLYTCADSFCALKSIVAELCESSSSEAKQTSPGHHIVIDSETVFRRTCEEQNSVRTMLHDAISERSFTPQTTGAVNGSSMRRRSGLAEESCTKDDIFVMLEDVPGTGIISNVGQPVVRILSDTEVIIVEDHFKAPVSRADHLTAAPGSFPSPFVQYFFKDMSFVWHFYGGRDFGSAEFEYMLS
ncbi:unnamed protein product [Soboliphyme baturini]|uniref:Autophagy-related protein 2 n=1 Tax=Soboliphyme baturini TaxID=241478 RepID=A0A183IL81_9BILA|nr:unnamed protein product [Soboliphyme baturini]